MKPLVEGMVASQRAPLPNDPAALPVTSKRRRTSYGPTCGVCELPPYAVYSHRLTLQSRCGETPIELDDKYASPPRRSGLQDVPAFTGSDWISNSMT